MSCLPILQQLGLLVHRYPELVTSLKGGPLLPLLMVPAVGTVSGLTSAPHCLCSGCDQPLGLGPWGGILDTQSYQVQGVGPPCGLKASQIRVLGQATSPLNLSHLNSDKEVIMPT